MLFIPTSKFKDYYDIARFNLTWNVSAFLFIVLTFLGITFLILDNGATIPTLLGSLVTFLLLVIMTISKSHILAAYAFSISGTFLCQFTLIYFENLLHFVDVIWIIMVVLFTYFSLGKRIGNMIFLINVLGVIYFILFVVKRNIEQLDEISEVDTIGLAINYVVVSLIIGYFIKQFVDTTKHAEKEYQLINSDLQHKNAQVVRQNEEKTVMLREIHHRVKNNLQVITSLLRLQSNELEGAKNKDIFSNTINRIVAMSLIHDKIYQNKDLAKINLVDYLKTLIDQISSSYSVDKNLCVDVKSNVEIIQPKNLVPIALIFNELISNSLKYAFISRDTGEIEIDIQQEGRNVKITYWDNGIWLEQQKPQSFGIELIETLVEQLDGEMVRSIDEGTRYTFNFLDKEES